MACEPGLVAFVWVFKVCTHRRPRRPPPGACAAGAGQGREGKKLDLGVLTTPGTKVLSGFGDVQGLPKKTARNFLPTPR